MDFIDHLRVLSNRIANTRDMIQTEEATKNAMVMPFIQILGYNVFDPLEVTPELVADVGLKKGEKVDYAILRDGKPIMLFECKKSGGKGLSENSCVRHSMSTRSMNATQDEDESRCRQGGAAAILG